MVARLSIFFQPFLITVLLQISAVLYSQPPALDWAFNIGGSLNEAGYDIITDSEGNVYVSGTFSGTMDFDPGPGTDSLTAQGGSDIFIQKLDSNGNHVWAGRIGNSQIERVLAMEIDSSGNLLIVGFFASWVDFDPGPGFINVYSSNEAPFVAKIDPNGNGIWAKGLSGNNYARAHDIEIDDQDNIYVTGFFAGTTDFDPGPAMATLTTNGEEDIFVVKLTSNGGLIWVKQVGGWVTDYGNGIGVDLLGNVYIGGSYAATVDFDPGPGTYSLSTPNNPAAFVLKLDSLGNFLWARRIVVGTFEETHLAVDPAGNVYSAGVFWGTKDFDPGFSSTYNLTSAGATDVFVQKLNYQGYFQWAKQLGGPYNEWPFQLFLAPNDGLYTIGTFSGTADFDPDTSTFNLISNGSRDIFIQKLGFSGSFKWAVSMGGPGGEEGRGVSVGQNLNVYSTGFFSDSADFDPGPGVLSLATNGGLDIFVQKLQQCQPGLPTPTQSVLPDIHAICEVDTPSFPMATSNCGDTIIGIPSDSFPITNQSIIQITWTYDDGYGNVLTQLQNLIWDTINTATFSSGASITASATNATYQWLDCNNNYAIIPGETSQSYIPGSSGDYAVELTQVNCKDTSDCVTFSLVGMESGETDFWRVFPNPGKGIFQLQGPEVQNAEIKVFDLRGRQVSATIDARSHPLRIILDAPAGTYILSVIAQEQRINLLMVSTE